MSRGAWKRFYRKRINKNVKQELDYKTDRSPKLENYLPLVEIIVLNLPNQQNAK